VSWGGKAIEKMKKGGRSRAYGPHLGPGEPAGRPHIIHLNEEKREVWGPVTGEGGVEEEGTRVRD